MTKNDKTFFIDLIREQFRPEDRNLIEPDSDLSELKEWSSLQIMIIVNEIDREYDIVLGFEDIRGARSVNQLYEILQAKLI